MTRQLFSLLLFLSIPTFGYSQATETKQKPKDTIPYEIRYNTLKKLYIKKIESASFRVSDSLSQLFNYKMTAEVSLPEIYLLKIDYLEWTKANLAKTEFKDIAEAEKLWKEYKAASKIAAADNKEYMLYFMEANKFEGGFQMQTDIQREVREKNPEKYRNIKLPKREKKSAYYPQAGPFKTN